MDIEFEVVPDEMRDELKSVKGNRFTTDTSPLVKELMEGKTVWVPVEKSTKLAGLYQSAKIRNYKNTVRKVVRDEKVGHLLWWTPKETPATNEGK